MNEKNGKESEVMSQRSVGSRSPACRAPPQASLLVFSLASRWNGKELAWAQLLGTVVPHRQSAVRSTRRQRFDSLTITHSPLDLGSGI